MKCFVQGSLELDQNVTDIVKYEEPIRPIVQNVIDWCTANNIKVLFGTSDDGTYLCEYDITGRTFKECNAYLSVLKEKLHPIFRKKPRVLIKWSGHRLY